MLKQGTHEKLALEKREHFRAELLHRERARPRQRKGENKPGTMPTIQ